MKTIKLKSVVDIQVGYQARGKIIEDPKGVHRLIQGSDFNESRNLILDNLIRFIPERDPDRYQVNKGDVLFQARGMDRFAFCIDHELESTLVAGSFYILRVRSGDVLPQYLAWWLNQDIARGQLDSMASGVAMPFASVASLLKLEVRIPDKEIQKKIVSVIELWQKQQALQTELSELRSKLIKAICMKAVHE